MKIHLILLFTLIFSQSSFAQNTAWDNKQRENYLQYREDPSSWNMEMLEMDLPLAGMEAFGPFPFGVFPVPEYTLSGGSSEIYVGNKTNVILVDEQYYYYNAFYVSRNTLNSDILGERSEEIFFQIILPVASKDVEAENAILSRNHPDYLGQGYAMLDKVKIDYSAFITAERQSFAIVNLRLFDLTYGNNIIIVPQDDNSLHSYQLSAKELSAEGLEEELRRMIKEHSNTWK